MKNRYLFKAKKESDNNWVQGFLSRIGETNSYQIDGILIKTNTICQCTGLKDCESNLIFEGDICKIKDRNILFKVTYEEMWIQFVFEAIKWRTDYVMVGGQSELSKEAEDIKIIGNIHDKKEKK